jgi:protein-L-isoaspartate(D-aspartate) O-methyltransferase
MMEGGDPRRLAMVARIEERVGPVRRPYRDALLGVDRAHYVRSADLAVAWIDEPLPLDTPHGHAVATISAPHVYVLAFEALELSRGDRFLELGSGSGYGAALAAYVVGPDGFVTTVDVDPVLVQLTARLDAHLPNVRAIHDDGLLREDLVATHDKTWLTFGVEEVPLPLLRAIHDGAVLVAPVGPSDMDQRLLRYRRVHGRLIEDDLGAVRFVRARGRIQG